MAMNQYLQDLLKETKTVIIPGFGALTITNESTGEVMFMSYLKFDDGTLVKHVAAAEGVDTDEAKSRIAKFVNEMTIVLDSGGSYQLKNFGTFKKVDGEVNFEKGDGAQSSESVTVETITPEPIEEAPLAEQVDEPAEPEVEIISEPVIAETPKLDLDAILENPMIDEAEKATETPEIQAETVEPVSLSEKEKLVVEEIQPVVETTPVVVEPELITKTDTTENNQEIVPEVIVAVVDKPEVTAVESTIEATKSEEPVHQEEPSANKAGSASKEKPKKKTGIFAYIIYGLLVLILGAGTYIAINFNDLKKDFPILADLAGENEAIADTTDLKELTNEHEEITSDTMPEAEPIPSETVEQPEITEPEPTPAPAPKPTPAPKPVSKPTPVSKPISSTISTKPISKTSSSSKSFPQPDLSKPYHIIAGSFSAEANAKRLANELRNKGMSQISVGEQGGMYRVSIKGFASKEEAAAALPSVQSAAPGAWVYNWK